MLAVDTNILIRFITNDDPSQTARAVALMRSNETWVAKTVLLELSLEDPYAVAKAFDLFAGGIDFADALHLACHGEALKFATFDQKLVRRSKHRSTCEVVLI